jgi:uncharacterized membrane protein
MSDYDFSGAWSAMMVVLIVLLCFLPLGVWKAVEIIIWLCHHIHWN